MIVHRRRFIAASGFAAVSTFCRPTIAQTKKLHFGVGPLLPSPDDTKKAYAPVFAHLAKELGADFDLVSTTDWAGMAVAMGSGQLDVAWMGPWGYVIANSATNCQAVATVKYDDKPIYHAIIIARPDLQVSTFPDDTKGKSISFADLGSTSGWLIPDLLREGSVENRSENILEVQRRGDACCQRGSSERWPGRHGDRLRSQSQRHDRRGQREG